MERVVFGQVYFSVKEQILMTQHGFALGRSTLTNLTSMSQFIADALDERGQLDVIYLMDMSKVFDTRKSP